jgi:hypothetical protein
VWCVGSWLQFSARETDTGEEYAIEWGMAQGADTDPHFLVSYGWLRESPQGGYATWRENMTLPCEGLVAVIPEPSTLILVLMGTVGLLGYAGRRNHACRSQEKQY